MPPVMSKRPHNQRGQQPQVQQQLPQHQQQQVLRAEWSGPLPPPAALEKFNQIIPGGADRILAMAEKEQTHRIEYEKTGLSATVNESKRGQWLGAFISLVAVVGSVYSAHIGAHWAVSLALVGVPVLGLVRAIIKPK